MTRPQSLAEEIAAARRLLGSPKPGATPAANGAPPPAETATGSARAFPGSAAGSSSEGGDSGTDCVQALIGQLAVRRQAIESASDDDDQWSDSLLDEWDD